MKNLDAIELSRELVLEMQDILFREITRLRKGLALIAKSPNHWDDILRDMAGKTLDGYTLSVAEGGALVLDPPKERNKDA